LRQLIDDDALAHAEEARRFYAARRAAAVARATPDPRTADGLAAMRIARTSSTLPPGRGVVECTAAVGARHAPVRVITPTAGTVRGVYLDIHAGGFFMESAARNDARNVRLADATGLAVVSVEYRLAPEDPWPAAPDDCETAALWILEESAARFGTDRVLVGGASAGATLAMTTLVRLRDRGALDRVAGAVLMFGAYDFSGRSPAGRLYVDEWFIEAYVGHVDDRTNPDISPLYADVRGLPPVFLVVGADDIVLEDTLAIAARLIAAGGDVDVRVYPDCDHGFMFHPTAMADVAWRAVDGWIDERLRSG
jgi:acetyl esterase